MSDTRPLDIPAFIRMRPNDITEGLTSMEDDETDPAPTLGRRLQGRRVRPWHDSPWCYRSDCALFPHGETDHAHLVEVRR